MKVMNKFDYLVSLGLALVAAILFYAGMASYAYPGESASLMAICHGLDTITKNSYPVMGFFVRVFGSGNALAPFAGAVIIFLLSTMMIRVLRAQMIGEYSGHYAGYAPRVAAGVAAFVLMLTPAFHSAATHLEPRLFDGMVTMLIIFFPVMFFKVNPRHWVRSWILLGMYLLATFGTYFVFGTKFHAPTTGIRWMFIFFFAVVPFVVTLFAGKVVFHHRPGWMQYMFQVGLSVSSVLAIATPMSPSALMEVEGILPIIPNILVAYVAGYLIIYWYMLICRKNYVWGLPFGGILAATLLFAIGFNLFKFDSHAGEFADKFAEALIKDMGDREWFVSDGSLDNHLKLVAEREGSKIKIISMSQDLNRKYLDELAQIVKDEKLGGDKNADLVMSVNLGVLPFLQDWLAAEKGMEKKVVIFGAPDLWYSVGKKPIPERMFFGADPNREPAKVDDLLALLKAPKGWGSMSIMKEKNPLNRMRLELRRHLGFVANNRGVYLQDVGDENAAFATYELVRNEIDHDNLCALFNLFEMSRQQNPKAMQKKNEYERALKLIVEDSSRRYRLWSLSNYYGYIRSPEIFLRLGFTWARSGRPGEALSQIRRAIDFIPTNKRASLLNMMASLYANEEEQTKSKRIYQAILKRDAKNHDALMGMMRLSLQEGKADEALTFLEKAAESSEGQANAEVEKAMVHLMKGELKDARTILQKMADKNPEDIRAWSLLAATLMQMSDASKDDKEKKALEEELEVTILPAMEKATTNPYDYYVQTTRAFLLMRKGAEARKQARDAFEQAMIARPDITTTQDMVLGLDISLDDPVSAERHARDILRRNRNAPLANYVMGAIAFKAGRNDEAERYLKRSADHEMGVALAMNDLAELYRREKRFEEAEKYARMTIEKDSSLYVAYETLGSIIMDKNGSLEEAELNIQKAVDLSKVNGREEDIRMLTSLARVLLKKGDKVAARAALRKVTGRVNELSEFEKQDYEELMKDAR